MFWDADAIYDKKKVVLEITTKQHWQKKYGFEVCLRGKASSDLKMLACLIDRFFKSTNFIKKCIVWSNHFFSNYYIHLCKIHKSWEFNKRIFFSSFWPFTKIITLSVCQKKILVRFNQNVNKMLIAKNLKSWKIWTNFNL